MLPEQGQFRTASPAQLAEDLQREHRAIRETFADAYRALTPAAGVSYVTSATWALSPYEMAVFGDDCTATLPTLGLEHAGVTVTIIRRGGTVTVASDTGSLVAGASSDSVSSANRVVYQYDGQDWWP